MEREITIVIDGSKVYGNVRVGVNVAMGSEGNDSGRTKEGCGAPVSGVALRRV